MFQKIEIWFGNGVNIMGKGETASYQHFLLFPLRFERALSLGSFNPFPNKPCFLRVCSTSLMKTL